MGREPTPDEFNEALLDFTCFVAEREAERIGKKKFKPKRHPHGSSTHIKIANILDIKAKMFRRK